MKTPPKPLLWGAALIALLALAWAAQRDPVQLVNVATVERGPLELNFLEEGKTRLKQRYVVAAPLAARVQRLALQPGDPVRAGQVVAQLEPVTAGLLDARMRQLAQAEVASNTSALQAARERIAAAQATQILGLKERQRLEHLAASGMATPSQLDQARAQAANADAALSTARAEVQMAEQRLRAAQAQLGTEGQGQPGTTLAVRSPVDGVVIRKMVESAVPVPLGQPLLEVGDPRALEIEVDVLSTDAVRLSPGRSARLLRWGGDGPLQARVTRIEPGGFTKVSALGVEEQRTRVVLDLTSPPPQWSSLGDAYRVEVEFILRQEADLLLVPANALFRRGDGWSAYVIEGGVARLAPVKLGLRGTLMVQVLEGLMAQQSVIVQPDDRIRDGTRVRAAAAPARAD